MKLTLCLIAAAYLTVDLCLWHGPLDRQVNAWLNSRQAVAARVHGQAITLEDLDLATQEDLFRRGQDWKDLDEPGKGAAGKAVLRNLIDGAMVRAARLEATPPFPSARNVDDELRLFIKQFPLDTDYPARLPLQHLNELQLRARMQAANDDLAWIEKQIAPQLAAVTEAEARAWYDTHKTELTVPESFHAAHVFLSGHEKDEKDDKDRGPEMAVLHQKLVSGSVSLEQLAATASEDDRTKATGGDLGWFTRSRMPADFMAAVAALSPGQLSAPLHTWLGWHVIKLIEKKPARIPAFDEVRDEVLKTLRNQRREEAVRGLLARLRG